MLEPAAARLSRVPPVALTIAGLGAGLLCAGAAYAGNAPVALALWGANRLLDGLDGAVARASDGASDRGGYLDLVADFITYATIPVAQVAGAADPGSLAVPLGALLGSYYLNAVSWLALSAILAKRPTGSAGTDRRARPGATVLEMPHGLVEGAETVAFVAACLAWPEALRPLFLGFAALVAITAASRVAWAWRHL